MLRLIWVFAGRTVILLVLYEAAHMKSLLIYKCSLAAYNVYQNSNNIIHIQVLIYFCFDNSVDYAVEMSHQALFFNMGQCCTAGSRTYVHEDIYDEFVKKSVARAQAKTVGDPFDAKNESGPQVSLALTPKYIGALTWPVPLTWLRFKTCMHVYEIFQTNKQTNNKQTNKTTTTTTTTYCYISFLKISEFLLLCSTPGAIKSM